jgi:hypothetical protein
MMTMAANLNDVSRFGRRASSRPVYRLSTPTSSMRYGQNSSLST